MLVKYKKSYADYAFLCYSSIIKIFGEELCMAQKHNWTFEENKYCCKRYIQQYVINKSSMKITEFSRLLEKEIGTISARSIKMKLQNIKQINIELGIEDSLNVTPLNQYSIQNKKAMLEVLNEMEIEY